MFLLNLFILSCLYLIPLKINPKINILSKTVEGRGREGAVPNASILWLIEEKGKKYKLKRASHWSGRGKWILRKIRKFKSKLLY